MQLSSGIIPERSSFGVGALGHTEITLHKQTAGNWTFLDKFKTKIPTGERCAAVSTNGTIESQTAARL